MAEYIDLNNTEVLTEAGENAKLVVEEDGELKRIPASAVGQVKTVNGVEPDEAGNVGVSYNNLLDKPFYEEELLSVKPTVDPNNIGLAWRKVSDNNLSTPLENGFNAQAWYGDSNGTVNVMVVGDLVIYGEAFAVFVKKANAVLDCMAIGLDTFGFITIFPEVGMYFLEKPEPMPLLGLAVAGASEPEIAWDGSSVRIKPLDAKFLPEGAGGMVVNFALDTTGTTSLKADKPFAEVWETIKSNKSVSAYMVVSASGIYSAMLLSMVAATDPSDVDGKQLIAFMTLDTTGDNVKVLTLKFYSDESVEVKNHTLANYVS